MYIGMGFPGSSPIKNLPDNAEDMGQEDPLEKEIATLCNGNPSAWEIP